MKTSNQIIIASSLMISIAGVVIVIANIKRMTQSIRGTLGRSYFTIDELCSSSTAKKLGIDNKPTPDIEVKLQALIDNVLNPIREQYGSYILVNSGYRCDKLNKAVGGASSSQHTKGEAADITGGNVERNRKIFQLIAESGIYDQLIWENGGAWVHVSYSGNNRRQMLAYNGSNYANITNNWQSVINA